MLTTKDLENTLKKNYVDFSEAVKAVLTEKLDNHPVIKSKMDEIEQYDSICEKCDEMKCEKKHTDDFEEKEAEPLDDDEDSDDEDSDDEDSDDEDSDDEDSDDEDLDESLSYERGSRYLIPLRETKGRRIRLKLVEKETYEGKLVDFDKDGVQLGWTWVEPGKYRIEGTLTPWKNIESIEFVKETGRRIF